MPNTNEAGKQDWATFRTSVDAIEARTGLDLFSNVPVAIQKIIEAETDQTTIQSVPVSAKEYLRLLNLGRVSKRCNQHRSM